MHLLDREEHWVWDCASSDYELTQICARKNPADCIKCNEDGCNAATKFVATSTIVAISMTILKVLIQ